MTGPRLVLVTWLDAHTDGGWQPVGQGIKESVCTSVGWLVEQSTDYIELAGTTAPDDDGKLHKNNTIAIPRGMIRATVELAPKVRRK